MRKYVQTKKRRIKIGDALVGMKRRGSQLRMVVSEVCGETLRIMKIRGGITGGSVNEKESQ